MDMHEHATRRVQTIPAAQYGGALVERVDVSVVAQLLAAAADGCDLCTQEAAARLAAGDRYAMTHLVSLLYRELARTAGPVSDEQLWHFDGRLRSILQAFRDLGPDDAHHIGLVLTRRGELRPLALQVVAALGDIPGAWGRLREAMGQPEFPELVREVQMLVPQDGGLPPPQVVLLTFYGPCPALVVDVGACHTLSADGMAVDTLQATLRGQGFTRLLDLDADQPQPLPDGWTVVTGPGWVGYELTGVLTPSGSWWWRVPEGIHVVVPDQWLSAASAGTVTILAGDLQLSRDLTLTAGSVARAARLGRLLGGVADFAEREQPDT